MEGGGRVREMKRWREGIGEGGEEVEGGREGRGRDGGRERREGGEIET